MFPEPDFQKAVVTVLNASAGLAAAMGGTVRAYDSVPPSPTFPYLHISDSQIIDDGNMCDDDLFELIADIHVWSRATGYVEAKKIMGQVRDAMKVIFAVPNFEIKTAKYEDARCFTDADGLSTHGVVTFRYLISTA